MVYENPRKNLGKVGGGTDRKNRLHDFDTTTLAEPESQKYKIKRRSNSKKNEKKYRKYKFIKFICNYTKY